MWMLPTTIRKENQRWVQGWGGRGQARHVSCLLQPPKSRGYHLNCPPWGGPAGRLCLWLFSWVLLWGLVSLGGLIGLMIFKKVFLCWSITSQSIYNLQREKCTLQSGYLAVVTLTRWSNSAFLLVWYYIPPAGIHYECSITYEVFLQKVILIKLAGQHCLAEI